MEVACDCSSSQGSAHVHTVVLISLLCSRPTAALTPKGQTQGLLPTRVLTILLFRADKYSGAKWGKSDFFSSAPLDASLGELEGLTGAQVNALICTTRNILSLGQQLLSHSQHGQFIAWNNFPHCCCYWKTKTAKANHCSSWEVILRRKWDAGTIHFVLYFIAPSGIRSWIWFDFYFHFESFLCALGSEAISKAMCFGGFICLSQWKKE